MKKLLNGLALICTLLLLSQAVHGQAKAVISISDSCENSDSAFVYGTKSSPHSAGDSISYQWWFTGTTSVHTGNGDTVKGIIFKDTNAVGKQLLTQPDTIWLKIYTWAKGNPVPTDSDSTMRAFTIKFNGIPFFTPISRCADSAADFINTTDNTSIGNGDFTWDYGDGSAKYTGLTAPSHVYPPYTPAVGGIFYPVLTVYWPKTGCFNKSAKNPINIYAKPTARIGVTIAECQDSIVRFNSNADSTYNSAPLQHSWDFGDATGSGIILDDTTSHLYTSTGKYLVTYITITENGCRDTDTASVFIHPKPTSSFTYANPCQNAPATFTDKSTVASGSITSWAWDFGDGTTSSTQSPQHTFTSSKTFRVKLTVTTANGCQDTSVQNITINSSPFMRIATPDVCLGMINVVKDMTTYYVGDTAQKWLWDFGDKSATSNTIVDSSSHTYAASGRYHITLTATTQLGCMDTVGTYVNVASLPVPDFSSAGSCTNQNVVFIDKSTVAKDIVQRTWDFGDPNANANNPNLGTGDTARHAYSAIGTDKVKLIVVTNSGCVDSITKTVTILQSPDTTFTTGTACEKSSLQFTYTGKVTAGLKFSWNFADTSTTSDTSTLENPTYTYGYGGLFNVQIITKDQNGCRSTGTSFVYVFPKPFIWITEDNLCVDSSIDFTAHDSFSFKITNPPSITNYQWDFGDGSAIQNTANMDINHKYTATGNYTVKVILTTSDGCTNSTSIAFTISPLPVADFSDPSNCNENGVTFTDNSSVSSGSITKWAWDFGDGGFATSADTVYKFQNTDTLQTVTLVVTTDHGCQAEAIKSAFSWQAPSSDFYFSGVTNSRACALDTVQLFSNSSPAVNELVISRYTWMFGDGDTTNGLNASHAWTTAGTYTVRLVSFSQHGCPDTTTLKDPNYVIAIDALPIANFTFGNYTCVGSPVSFFDASTFGNNVHRGLVYWDLGDGYTIDDPSGDSVTPTHIYKAAGTYFVRIYRTNAVGNSGCKSDTVTNPVTIYPTPKADFMIQGTCQNRPTQFIDLSKVSPPSIMDTTKYSWDFGDNLTASDVKNPTHTYLSAGNYVVKLNVADTPGGCTANFDSIIYVQPSPVAKFSVYPNPVGNDTPLVTFTDSSTGDFILTRYWDYGDSTHDSNPVKNVHLYHPIDPIDTGTYLVFLKLTNKYSCSDSTYQYVHIKQFLKLDGRFPSAFTPNGDGLNDIWHPITRGVLSYHCIIFDRWGQIVYTTDDWNDPGWKGDYRGNGVRVPEGVYVYYAYLTDYDNLEYKKAQGTITVLR